jgi:hypothetical protein
MKTLYNNKIRVTGLLSIALFLITSCSPQIKLTSSWADKQATVKSSPQIMVMVLGKPNSTIRRDIENNIVARLKKDGYRAVPASDLFQPGVKHDSAELVGTLRKNNIDMLLTNAVISRTENERFIPSTIQGTDIVVPSGGAASVHYPDNQIYVVGYNNYYNYYNAYNSYQTIEAQKGPGTTVTDIQIIIESNLYEVSTTELLWHGQSSSSTKEPSASQISAFSRNVISDIKKNNLLVK